jgi:hypothetical protein
MDLAAVAAGLPPSPRFKLLFFIVKIKHSFLFEALDRVRIGHRDETKKR